jgi:SpoVK/Ycf46/Vps4 family AAA+-type ATPase
MHLKKQSDDVMSEALAKLDDIVGLETVKENIKRIIASIKMNKLRDSDAKVSAGHYIFKGNPGTGKTTVARIFGEILKELKVLKKRHFYEATREDLVQGFVGQTAIKTKEVLESSLGGVLFIDEAYSLSQGGENDFGQEAINTIVPFMENNIDNFTLIVAGYDEDMDKFLNANTGLKSRFTNTIIFDDYSNEEMLSIFKTFVKKDGYSLGIGLDEKLINIFQNIREHSNHFGNGRDARKVFNSAKSNLDMRLSRLDDLVQGDSRLTIIELEDLD